MVWDPAALSCLTARAVVVDDQVARSRGVAAPRASDRGFEFGRSTEEMAMATAVALSWQTSKRLPSIAFVGALVLAALIAPLNSGFGVVEAGSTALPPRAQHSLEALPTAARAPVSETVGRRDRSYHARSTTRGLTLANRPQRLEASFAPAGVHVVSGAAQ